MTRNIILWVGIFAPKGNARQPIVATLRGDRKGRDIPTQFKTRHRQCRAQSSLISTAPDFQKFWDGRRQSASDEAVKLIGRVQG